MSRSSNLPRGRYPRFRRGVSLLEVITTTMLLATTLIMALAMFPFSRFLQDRSNGYSTASAIVDKKLEQIRSLDAKQLTPSNLRTAGMGDAGTSASTVNFTQTESVATKLRSGTGVIQLSGTGTDLVRADVTVSWVSMRGQHHSVTGSTYVAEKSVWREP